MNGAIIDFESELSRHNQFFAREGVLSEIHTLLDSEYARAHRWVLLLGSPGVGKSAIIARILQTIPGPTPHHLLRRGVEGWDRPDIVVQNLCAQIEQIFPGYDNAELPSEVRLGELLRRLSREVLVPFEKRLILVIDGLDEAVSDPSGENPLPRFLPRALPPGVIVLCASRPTHPHLHWLTERDGLRCIDLDGASSASNEAACRAFWEYQATRFSPPIDRTFIDLAVRHSEGNLLYAVRLRDWLEGKPVEQRAVMNIPLGLTGFLEQIWVELHKLSGDGLDRVLQGLGLICAAREALPEYLIPELLGWQKTSDVDEFLRVTRPFLLAETAHWHKGVSAFRPYHECFREFVVNKLGEPAMREHHRRITKTLAAWPVDERYPNRKIYTLRHAVTHRLESGEILAAQQLCTDISYLEKKCREIGVSAVELDLEATVRALGGDASLTMTAVLAALSAEATYLRADPSAMPLLLFNRLRRMGWSEERIKGVLDFSAGLPPLRLLHRVRLGTTLLRTFNGHNKPVIACVPIPGKGHILSASADRTLRLWSLRSGECVAVMPGHEGELTACAVKRDGRTAISTSTDATIRVWDLAAQRCVAKLDNEGRWSTACAIIPDSQRVVIGSDDGSLRIFEHDSLQPVAALLGHTDYVTACAVTQDSLYLVSASRDESVRVWELVSGNCIHVLKHPPHGDASAAPGAEERWITALVVTPDSKQVIAAAGDGSISWWDLSSGSCARTLRDGQERIDTCAITPDGLYLLCGIKDGTIRIWDLKAGRCIDTWKAHQGAVSACCATLSGRRIVSTSSDRSLKLWELGTEGSLGPQERHTGPITACAVSLDGERGISASEDRTVRVWDLVSGAQIAVLEGHEELVTACAVSEGRLRIVSGTRDGRVHIWRRTSPKPVHVFREHSALVSGCAITPSDQLITSSYDRTIHIWSLTSFERLAVLAEHDDAVEGCAITPDGAWLLSFSRDGTVKLWDLATYKCAQTLAGLGYGLRSGTLTPDGRYAVLAWDSGIVDVHDLRSGEMMKTLQGHTGRVFGCAVSPDGRRVVSASEDATLRIWSIETGELLGTLYGTRMFRCVAARDAQICAGDEDGNLWVVASSAEACSPRDMQENEYTVFTSRSAQPSLVWRAPEDSEDHRSNKPTASISLAIYVPNAISNHPLGTARILSAPIKVAYNPRSRRPPTRLIEQLRDALAELYPTPNEACVIISDVALEVKRINLTGTAETFWHAILDEAWKQGLLAALVRRVQRTYPDDPDLADAAEALGLD